MKKSGRYPWQDTDNYEWIYVAGIPASRYIASWYNEGGGKITYGDNTKFTQWLRRLELDGKHLTDDDIAHIVYIAVSGKLELEYSARAFIQENL